MARDLLGQSRINEVTWNLTILFIASSSTFSTLAWANRCCSFVGSDSMCSRISTLSSIPRASRICPNIQFWGRQSVPSMISSLLATDNPYRRWHPWWLAASPFVSYWRNSGGSYKSTAIDSQRRKTLLALSMKCLNQQIRIKHTLKFKCN